MPTLSITLTTNEKEALDSLRGTIQAPGGGLLYTSTGEMAARLFAEHVLRRALEAFPSTAIQTCKDDLAAAQAAYMASIQPTVTGSIT